MRIIQHANTDFDTIGHIFVLKDNSHFDTIANQASLNFVGRVG